MSLRVALLLLLTHEPMTGYDLHQSFQRSTGNLWRATDAQIYPELRRMEREGLIAGEDEAWGAKAVKRWYHVTADGHEYIAQWMREPMHDTDASHRDPMRLRAGYFEWTDPETARRRLREHIRHHEQEVALYQSLTAAIERYRDPAWVASDADNSVLGKRLRKAPSAQHERIIEFKLFAYDGMISAAKAEIAWARRGLRLLRELDASAKSPASGGDD